MDCGTSTPVWTRWSPARRVSTLRPASVHPWRVRRLDRAPKDWKKAVANQNRRPSSTQTVRNGSRLNKVLLLRLEPEGYDPETKDHATEGVVA